MGVLGIALSLFLLMFLAYRGVSVIILAPVLALMAAFIGGGTPLLATYTEVFMVHLANYARTYFPLFLLGAVFGKVLDDSGAARTIAHYIAEKLGKDRAVLAIVISCGVLTYGGVSLFVVAFAVYPIAAALFREARIPKRLIPATIALGSFTFSMTALPGTPQIQNAIPMPFFGTDAYAAPVLGLVGALIMAVGGILWISWRAKKAMSNGEDYGDHVENHDFPEQHSRPGIVRAMLPIFLVLILNFVLSKYVFLQIDTAYLKDFNTSLQKVAGLWSLITSLVFSIILTVVLNFKNFKNVMGSVNQGATGSLLALINTASEVGYGNVISSLAAFTIVKEAIMAISTNPLISEAVSVSVLAGITGSASGGLSIALGALGKTYLANAQAMGIDPQVLHRIATMACGGLDSLPHNGAVITLLTITGLTHKQSYADIGMCTVVIPIIAVAVAIFLAGFGVV